MARKGGMATGVEVARISVKVSPDTKKFRSELQQELNRIEKEVKGDVEVKAHIDRAQAQADFDRFMEKLKSEGAKGVKIKTTVEESKTPGGKGKGRKGGGSDGADAVDEASRLGKMLSRIKDKLTEAPSFGSGINITGYLVILTAIAAVAAPLAGLLTGLLLTLPGLLALILTPIGAIMLGLDGMKKAAEVLQKPFEDLKNTMNQAVQSQFTPVFEKLRAIFPSLSAALPSVTKGLADMADAAIGIATSPKSMAAIESTIFNIGAALSAASPGIGNLTEGLIGLAQTFTAGPLQGLVGWFNGAMESFNKWIQKAQASGQLETIFKRVGEALKIVMDALGAVAGIGLDVITDPAKWEVFVGLLKGVAAAFVYIFKASAGLIAEIALLIALFRSGFAFIQGLVGSVMGAILTFFTNLPAWAQSAWAGVKTGATAVWETIKSGASDMAATVGAWFQSIPGLLSAAWAILGGIASSAWEGVKGIVQTSWEGIKAVVQGAINGVITTLSGWGAQIIGIITSIDLLSAGKALIQRFIDGISSMAGAVVGAAKRVFGGIMNLIPHSPAKEGPFSGAGWNELKTGGAAIATQFGKGLEEGFTPVIDQAKGMASQIADAFANGGDPTAALKGFGTKDVNRMEKSLGLESKRLGYQAKALEYQAKMAGKGPLADQLKAKADEIKMQKEALDLQKEMLDLTNEYNDANSSGKSSGNVFLDAINELMKLPNGFIDATVGQAQQDLGMSGNGALQAVGKYAMDYGSKFIFNVQNVDQALAAQNNVVSRQAQGVAGR